MLGDIGIALAAFLAGTALASVAGAANLGVAMGVGQILFGAAVMALLMYRR